jgi:acetyltransferase-like isoleucine patch superfamily enzyme
MILSFLAKHQTFIRRVLTLDKIIVLKFLGLSVGKRTYIARTSSWPLRYLKGINIGSDVIIGKNTHLGVNKEGSIVINSKVGVGEFCRISSYGLLVIEEGTLIADNVVIQNTEHTFKEDTSPCSTPLEYRGIISIGKNCFIGRNSVILGGTILPDNTRVGANSIVQGYYSEAIVLSGQKATIKKYL